MKTNPQLHRFMEHCKASPLDNVVLDCGAGIPGEKVPPLVLFQQEGFKTYGVDISARNIETAQCCARRHQVDLRLTKGDMRRIPFADDSVSFVLSYNTIYHMSKADMAAAMAEIKRVLKPGGSCYVNFFSVEHSSYGRGEKVTDGEFNYDEEGRPMVHTFLRDHEADALFVGMEIVHREKRRDPGTDGKAFIDYIATKGN
jgi:ubiquinone/menaquinone biosynthesis C-methylase UbiE